MIIRVLGAAAGGGVPQWNCACRNCMAARCRGPATHDPVIRGSFRRRGSLGGAERLARHTRSTDRDPRPDPSGLRGSPVCAAVVTNADVDHIAGLLTLREMTAFDLFASAETHAVLAANPVFGVLDGALVVRREIAPDVPFLLPLA